MGSTASIAQNIDPPAPYVGKIGWATFTSANTSKTGSGATSLFTAGTNGSLVYGLSALPSGGNVQTVLRVFINNGSSKTLFMEKTLPETTLSETTEQMPQFVPMNLMIPSGYSIEATIGTAVSAGWQVTCRGGDY